MSDDLDHKIRSIIAEKQYDFDVDAWNDFKSYNHSHTTVGKKLSELDYNFEEKDWKAFLKYKNGKNQRRMIGFFILGMILILSGLYFMFNQEEQDLVSTDVIAQSKVSELEEAVQRKIHTDENQMELESNNLSSEVEAVDSSSKSNHKIKVTSSEVEIGNIASTTEKSSVTNTATNLEFYLDQENNSVLNQQEDLAKQNWNGNHETQEITKNELPNQGIKVGVNQSLNSKPGQGLNFKEDRIHFSLRAIEILNLNTFETAQRDVLMEREIQLTEVLQTKKKIYPVQFQIFTGALINGGSSEGHAGLSMKRAFTDKFSVELGGLVAYRNMPGSLLDSSIQERFSFGLQTNKQSLVLSGIFELGVPICLHYHYSNSLSIVARLTPMFVHSTRAIKKNYIGEGHITEENIWTLDSYNPDDFIQYGLGIEKKILKRSALAFSVENASYDIQEPLFMFQFKHLL